MEHTVNVFILNETFTNGLTYNWLDILSFTSVVCGIFVITSKNPVVSVLFLIGLFLNIAGYLMLLGIHFIGLSYLLVYVGAVSILFLFILMLINVRVSELVTDTNNSVPLALLIGLFFNIILYNLLPQTYFLTNNSNTYSYDINLNINSPFKHIIHNVTYIFSTDGNTNEDLSFVSSEIWDGAIYQASHITSVGDIIYTVYPIWLLLTSIILLLAMVGAIVITIKQ